MKKYLINFYVVEEDAWNLRNYFTVDASELAKSIRGIESRGFRLTFSNIFVKTFTSSDDDKLYFAYTVVELPNL